MERVAPGGSKEPEKQDGNLRLPDLNVTAYYCHCRSAFISGAAGLAQQHGSLDASAWSKSNSQASQDLWFEEKNAAIKWFLIPPCCSSRFFSRLAPPAA